MASMDSFKTKGEGIQSDIAGGVEKIQDMGKEFQDVKDTLDGVPDGLDDEIKSSIQAALDSGKAEVQTDINSVKDSVMADAKRSADTVKSDVQTKITDNNSARATLDAINSKYGKSDIASAKTSLDSNTKMGEDLIQSLEKALEQAAGDIQSVEGSI